jgi:hypothetical protein
MADLAPAFEAINLPKPATFASPEDPAQERGRRLVELVWDKIPKHLVRQPVRPEFAPLLQRWEWGVSWVLLGQTGSGKSTACVHLIRELLRRGKVNGGEDFARAKSIFWTRSDAVTQAGGRDDEHSHKLLHRAEFSRLMVLDDVADPSKTLLRIIQQRYDAQRPLIVTCGALDQKSFVNAVGGEAVARWILECGGVRKGVMLRAKP